MKKALTVFLLLTAAAAFGATAKTAKTAKSEEIPDRETAAKQESGTAEKAETGTGGENTASASLSGAVPVAETLLPLDAVEGKQLIPYIGSNPQKAFDAFGCPVSLNVLRGAEPSLDDVVSVHETGVYLFWFQDRVWEIGFGSYFTGTFEGVNIGMKEAAVIEKLGKPLLRDEKMIVYEIFHREFPVRMRFVIGQGKVSEMYLYRSDL